MQLKVNDFGDGGEIPEKYTCDGKNLRPDFSWNEAPEGTQSIALSCIDPDVPREVRGDGIFSHWLVVNIPASVTEVKGAAPLPEGAIEIENDFGRGAWGGPCPPDREHRYFFKVYALDVAHLDPSDLDLDNFEEKIAEHVLAEAQVIGRYCRPVNR